MFLVWLVLLVAWLVALVGSFAGLVAMYWLRGACVGWDSDRIGCDRDLSVGTEECVGIT